VRLSVTTPRGSLVEAEVDEVTAPGALGEFGVLPGHVPFLSALQPGVFSFRTKDQTRVLAVSEGVLEVARVEGGGDKVLVLVSDALHAEEVERDAAEKEVADADAELNRWNRDLGGEHKALLTRRAWAAARVAASTRVAH
jgi:F-type H+-transporting ATPase subunit epsilon